MKITMVGTGYVGLVTGTCLADVGNEVLCLDVNPQKIETLQKGGIPIYEPGLEPMVRANVASGRLRFTTNVEEAVAFGDIQFIAVGTPPDEDGSADLTHVLEAARNIGCYMTGYKLVVDKSTVPVGTADQVKAAISKELEKRGLLQDFCVASNPEFLKEGAAVEDFMKPDRIVIGTNSEQATALLRTLYAPFQRNHERLMVMDVRSAELTKYAANGMLAIRISFMNELSHLAEKLGADIEEVRRGIGSDPRIGYHFLYPGCGYGGSCFPKDVRALQKSASDVGVPMRLIAATEAANDAQKTRLFEKITARFGKDLKGRRFALWGLAFKPNTDDMREAPSRVLMEALWAAGATVMAHDPAAMQEAMHLYGTRADFVLVAQPMDALHGADALIIATEWKAYRSPNFDQIKQSLKAPIIIDGRNLYDPKTLKAQGFTYEPIGRLV